MVKKYVDAVNGPKRFTINQTKNMEDSDLVNININLMININIIITIIVIIQI